MLGLLNTEAAGERGRLVGRDGDVGLLLALNTLVILITFVILIVGIPSSSSAFRSGLSLSLLPLSEPFSLQLVEALPPLAFSPVRLFLWHRSFILTALSGVNPSTVEDTRRARTHVGGAASRGGAPPVAGAHGPTASVSASKLLLTLTLP